MPWTSMTGNQQITVRLVLIGGPQYNTQLKSATMNTRALGAANNATAASMNRVTTQAFLMRQALFTARRFIFYATLGLISMGAAVAAMGFKYNSAMQQTSVALLPVIKNQNLLNKELQELFRIAAFTPFTVKDITQAFRVMYAGFQPLGFTIKEINDLITALTNTLSFTGRVTPAQLNKVSFALQHMANIGYLTGYAVQQLARDGVQLMPVLRKELGVTAEGAAAIAKLKLPSDSVVGAIIAYSKSTPGIMGAALAQSNKTLFGAWSTFKDILGQAAGMSEGGFGGKKGVFGGLQQALVGVNKQLKVFYDNRKPVTITAIAEAIDKQLSPSTHGIMNTFVFFKAALTGLVGTFYALYKIINWILIPFNWLGKQFHSSYLAAKILGYWVGILTALWLTQKGVLLANVILVDLWSMRLTAARRQTILLTLATIRLRLALIGMWATLLGGLFVAALVNPFFWIFLAIVGIVILYFKWKKFHDIVNRTAYWLRENFKWFKSLLAAFGPVGLIVAFFGTLVQYFRAIARAIAWAVEKLKQIPDLTKKGLHFVGDTTMLGFQLGNSTPGIHWPRGGSGTGDSGTKSIIRTASGVTPVTSTGDVGGTGRGTPPIHVQLVVDRKVLAETVARARQDRAARR